MTDIERAQLKVKCVEMFVVPASRHTLTSDDLFKLADRAFQFAIEGLGKEPSPITARPGKGKG